MAHRRRHRRHYRGVDIIPGLGNVATMITKSSVRGLDVMVGAVGSLLGIAALKWLLARPAVAGKVPALVLRFQPALAGFLAAFGLYYAQRKKNRHRAIGHAVGAATAGVAFNILNEAKAMYPAYFADIVDLRLAGVIINDPAVRAMLPQMSGVIVDEPDRAYAGAPDFAAIAAAGEPEEDAFSAP